MIQAMQIWTAKQSYYDKAGVQILIMSDIFQIYTSHNDASSMSPCKGQDRLEIIIMSTKLSTWNKCASDNHNLYGK